MGVSAIIGSIIGAFESVGSGIAAFGSGLATDLGAGAGIASAVGTGLEGAAFGSLTGATEAALTGHNVWEGLGVGALTGGITGGFGPALGEVTGLGTTVGDTLAGAGAGALGAEITHGNPLVGALTGAGSGLLTGLASTPTMQGQAGALAPPGVGGGPLAPSGALAPSGVSAGAPDVGGVPAAVTTPDLNLDATSGAAGTLSATTSQLPGDIGTGAAGSNIGATGLSLTQPPSGLNNDLGDIGGTAPMSTIAGGDLGAGPATAGTTPAGASTAAHGNWLKTLTPLIPAAGLLLDAGMTQKKPYNFSTLEAQAGKLSNQGDLLRSYINSGTLPPGEQGNLNAATAAAGASIASQYAARGMTGSSAEAQDMQNLQLRAQAQAADEAARLFSQGVQETGMADQLYTQLMQVQLQEDAEMSQAFGTFASALAGMGRPVAAAASG